MNLSSIFKMIILSSVTGSVIAIIILVIKEVFKNRLNAFWQYYIWFLLIIRLIIPAGFETPLSKFNNIEFAAEKIRSYSNSSKTANDLESVSEINLQNISEVSGLKLNGEDSLKETVSKDFNYYFNIASIIWVLGAVFAFLIILNINCIFIFKVYKQPFCEDEDTLKVLEECKSTINISRDIPIICDRYVKVPSLLGNIKPKILISSDFILRLSAEQKKYIFLHELSHFKRKDIFISWIILFCGILNWFNPIIWFSLHRMWEDCELACDAYVLSHLKEKEQGEYGKTIIDMAKFVSDIKYIPGATGIIKGNSNIKRRIIMIKNFKKTPYKWISISACILAAVGIVGITNSRIKAETLKSESVLLQTRQSDINYVNIVKKFLPQNSQIVDCGSTKEEDNILLKDLDNDGINEIITAYKLVGEDEKINILVLKKNRRNWIKTLDEKGEGFELASVLAEDMDGDGQNEVLLNRRVGSIWVKLSIYKWNNNLLSKASNEELYYSNLDIVDVPGKNIKAIATWTHDTGNAYIVDVLKWDGKTFISSKDLYANYFKKSVVPYYEQKVKEMPNYGYYWYYLGDAQMKAGDKEAALKSIEIGFNLNTGYPSKEDFSKLKEEASK